MVIKYIEEEEYVGSGTADEYNLSHGGDTDKTCNFSVFVTTNGWSWCTFTPSKYRIQCNGDEESKLGCPIW